MIDNNANVNQAEKFGDTPLHIASERNFLKIVKFLVHNKAYMNLVNYDGEDPIYIAGQRHHREIVKFFVAEKKQILKLSKVRSQKSRKNETKKEGRLQNQ